MSDAVAQSSFPPISKGRRTVALWVILLAFFMDLLDTTIVNVAIPSVQKELGTSYSSIQWIIAGYALTFALFLITGGRLGDIFGYKKLFLLGVVGFTVASTLCGFAVSSEMLIASRLFQGFCAAMMVPQILSTIQVMYTTTAERQGISAFYGALAGIASVGGPIIGALLISWNLFDSGWRLIFLVNVPFGLAAIVLGFVFLPDQKSPHPLRLDLVGVALIIVAMLMLMYPLIQGRQLDWPQWTFVSMAASFVVFVLFGVSQVLKDRRDGSPLVVPKLFRARSFVVGITLMIVFYSVVSSFFLVLTLFTQLGLGYSVLKAGLTGIPFSVGVSVAAGLSGPVLVPRFGRAIVTAGPLLMIVGFLLLILTIRSFDPVTPWEMIPALLVSGVGMGFVVAPIYPFVLAEVALKDAGSASGVINAVGQIGGAIGVAAIGVVFFGLLGSQATSSVDSIRDRFGAALTSAGVPSFAVPSVISSFEACYHDRVNAKDPSAVPESCTAGEKAQAAFAAASPDMAKAVGPVVAQAAADANTRNFTDAFTKTLFWQMGVMSLAVLLSLLLPRQPRRESELAEAGVTAA